MAFFIKLNKLTEDDKFVVYEYGSTNDRFGKI